MRTTLTLDDDVAAAIEQVRRDEGLGISEVVNRLVRLGLVRQAQTETVGYRHRSSDLGLKVDVSNVGEVLDLLDLLDG